MIKRTIDISDGPAYVCVRDEQLVLKRRGEEIARIPCEDVGVLLIDHPAVTCSHAALERLTRNGAAVVLCGPDHLPAGLLLPMEGNALMAQRVRAQAEAPLPLRKRLWQQIVRAKIAGQAGNLAPGSPARGRVGALVREVRSGDPNNREAVAARCYWQALLGSEFRRDPAGAPPNCLLNYGYMAMRAAVARAVCAAGLHPALGLNHRNRSNAFCLADDLVEPLRPLVDAAVVRLWRAGVGEVGRDSKRTLLGLLAQTVEICGESGPLMVSLHRMAASLVRCYEGESKRLELPGWKRDESGGPAWT